MRKHKKNPLLQQAKKFNKTTHVTIIKMAMHEIIILGKQNKLLQGTNTPYL